MFGGNPIMVFSGPEPAGAQAGLAVFNFQCGKLSEHGPQELRLVGEAGEVLHRRALNGDESFWLALNTHYLADGIHSLEFGIYGAEPKPLWSTGVKLHVSNGDRLAPAVLESMRRRGTPQVFDGRIESGFFDYGDRLLTPWFDRPDALEVLEQRCAAGEIQTEDRTAIRQFITDGYAILEHRLDDAQLVELNKALDWVIDSKFQAYTYGSSQRIQQLHCHNAAVAQLWRNPRVLEFLTQVFGAPALPCQTLAYVFGSQQDFHQDTIHLTPFPAGYMCGVWVALEDVREGSGELAIIPGSHRLPRVYRSSTDCKPVRGDDWTEFGAKVVGRWESLVKTSGLSEMKYRPRRGSILVWHENLMHGGSPRRDMTLSRRSIVSHYFAQGSIAYYDSTAMPGYMFI